MSSEEKASIPLSPWIIDVGVAVMLGLAILYVWGPTLGIRFYQDDYWVLFLTQNPYLGLAPGAIPWAFYWRPLGLFVPFYVMRRLFGLDPFVFHVANLSIHLLNGVLVYRLGLVMMKMRTFALVAAIFYSLHLAHTRAFQWAVGMESLLSATWFLLAFRLYLRFRQEGHRWAYWASLIAFTAALLTKEWSVSFVPVLLWYELVCNPSSRSIRQWAQWKSVGIPLAGYCVPLSAYLAIRMSLYSFSSEGQYALIFGKTLALRNLAQHLDRAIFPAAASGFSLQPTVAGLLAASLLCMLLLSWTFRWRLMTFGLGWFVLTLSPVLFISRLESYFLVIPLVGLAMTVGAICERTVQILPLDSIRRRAPILLASILFGTMLLSAAKEVRIQQEAPWMVKPQRFVDCTLAYVSNRWPSLPAHSVLFFRDLHIDEPIYLGKGSAINVYYNDNTIRTSFMPHPGFRNLLVNTTATPSPLDDKIIHREALAAFCENSPLLRLQ